MEISEQDLRAMIRAAIAEQAAGHAPTVVAPARLTDASTVRAHASHGVFHVVATADGQCLIEPSVECNHCGYCKSLGH